MYKNPKMMREKPAQPTMLSVIPVNKQASPVQKPFRLSSSTAAPNNQPLDRKTDMLMPALGYLWNLCNRKIPCRVLLDSDSLVILIENFETYGRPFDGAKDSNACVSYGRFRSQFLRSRETDSDSRFQVECLR